MKIRAILISTALLFACPANAATYLTTYTGTIATGSDGLGAFGTPGASLVGLAFTAVFELTSPLPGAFTGSAPAFEYISGGSSLGPGVPSPVSGKLTINGNTVQFFGSELGVAQINNETPVGVDQIRYYAEHNSGDFRYVLGASAFSTNNFINLTNLTTPVSYTLNNPGDGSVGNFDIRSLTNLSAPKSTASFNVSSVTVSPFASAVPEPATWATMLLGFGLMGAAMRYRRRPKVSVRFA